MKCHHDEEYLDCKECATKYMWEIMVPTHDNQKKKFPIKHHRQWDAKAIRLTGGLTIMNPSKGRWINEGTLESEKVIPVHIACTEDQFYEIMDFTVEHYKQKEVLGVKLGEIIIRRRDR